MDKRLSPLQGGCWICCKEDEEKHLVFDWGFDSFVHKECLEKYNCKNIHEYETRTTQKQQTT